MGSARKKLNETVPSAEERLESIVFSPKKCYRYSTSIVSGVRHEKYNARGGWTHPAETRKRKKKKGMRGGGGQRMSPWNVAATSVNKAFSLLRTPPVWRRAAVGGWAS